MSREIRITPSILNADFSDLLSEIDRIALDSDLVHLDVMDDKFVPNFTFTFEAAADLISKSTLPVDAHLMVLSGDTVGPMFAEFGCKSVTVHAEATENISQTLRQIRKSGARAGLALKPASQIEDYSDLLSDVDMILIMTVEPGFGGQSFMSDMISKIEKTRKLIGSRPVWLQVDGGISEKTIESAAMAGADTFVAGSAVFKSDDPAAMVRKLRSLAQASVA
jgi:ribulose-phosphate 3-epimerase